MSTGNYHLYRISDTLITMSVNIRYWGSLQPVVLEQLAIPIQLNVDLYAHFFEGKPNLL